MSSLSTIIVFVEAVVVVVGGTLVVVVGRAVVVVGIDCTVNVVIVLDAAVVDAV